MESISPPIEALIELFTTTLADVRFADVDARTLARFAGEVDAAAGIVASAQAALDAALCGLHERQDLLLAHAQRAVSYARVYAEGDAELTARVEAISLPRTLRRARPGDALILSPDPQPAPRPRGRPRKVRDEMRDEAQIEVIATSAE
jgi:hypothetical protein